MFDRFDSHITTSPEDALDRWLDAMSDPNQPTPLPPAGLEGIASVARRYQSALAVTPEHTVASSAIPERNGHMNHALPVPALPTAASWETIGPSQQRQAVRPTGWLSWFSSSLSTAVVIGLIVALSGTMIYQQNGLPGESDDPASAPGFAASPEATPNDLALSCGSPGYRPVIYGEVDEQSLAAIGVTEEPIVIGDGEATVPLPNGAELTVPGGDVVSFDDPGTAVTRYDDGASTVTRLSDGESWDFPSPGSSDPPNVTLSGNGRYYVAPTDETRTDWFVLDTHTGERTTTADILGKPFEEPTTLFGGHRFLGQPTSSEDLSTFVVNFMETVSGRGNSNVLPVLVIPGSIADAYFDDLSSDTTVSPGGDFLASFGNIIEAKTGETFSGVDTDDFRGYVDGPFIGFIDDAPTILAWVDDEVRSIHPSTGGYEVVFQADASIEAVGYDHDASSLVVGTGQPGDEAWTWLDLDTGARVPLPELNGYQLNRVNPVTPAFSVRHLTGVADFIQADSPRRLAEPIIISEYTVRALDMEIGTISSAVTNQPPAGREFSGDYLPTIMKDGLIATQDPSGNFTVLQPGAGTSVAIPKPANVDLAIDQYLGISSTPSEQCLMLTTADEDSDWTHHTYVAPIEPGATWTELNIRIGGWVEIPEGSDVQTLPAQDIATPAAFLPDQQTADGYPINLRADPTTASEIVNTPRPGTPLMSITKDGKQVTHSNDLDPWAVWVNVGTEDGHVGWIREIDLKPFEASRPTQEITSPVATPAESGLSCASPGYRPIISGDIDRADLALIGSTTEPISLNGETTITAANGTEITLDASDVWTRYWQSDVILSGDDDEDLDTVTTLHTGESWTFPDLVDDPNRPQGASFVLVGNWLLGPTDESALTWTIINITTGEERLTNDILGEPFEQPPVPLIQPWTDTTQTPMIIAFSGAPERSPSTIVLLSADLDDAYALNPNHAFAGGNGVITADGSRIAYISPDNTVNVLDGFTGELISQHPLPETDDIYRVVGLTSDDSTLILRDNQQVWTVDLASGELTSIFDPAGFIESFEFDKTTSTIIASAGDRQQPSFFWIDPASGTVKPLDITRPSGNPFPAFGWALIQTQNPDQFGVSYTLLDMTTGETDASWSAIGDDNDANVTIVTITGGGNDPAGIFVVQSELGTMIVLDGPAGRGFEIALPDDGSRRRINTAIGVSPSGGCIVYTEVAQPGEDQGTSWIAPLEPDAEWTKLRFELSGWWEPVEPAPAATPAPDLASPVATPDL